MYYIGVDVGTGSVRAALVGTSAQVLAQATVPIKTWRFASDSRLYEQSGQQIWDAIAHCVRTVVQEANVAASDVHGIGFDATCSLVVVRKDGSPVCVTPSHLPQDDQCNIILWADHRAEAEAQLINQTGHKVLNYVGGTMSLEMETPKILWLKKHWPAALFDQCEFFDLPDYLTFRATQSRARSFCSLVCKCGFIPPGTDGSTIGWQSDFLDQIGLGSLGPSYDALGGIPGQTGMVLTAGMPVGAGLAEAAAHDLGLMPHTPVGSGVIDAYAGWVGTVAASSRSEAATSPTPRLADAATRLIAIAGTSTCYCIQSDKGIAVPGVWGPYKNAIFPGMWMNEGGQSSTGQLIDMILETHPAYAALQAEAQERHVSPFSLLEETLATLMTEQGLPCASPSSYAFLVRHMHMYPDFYGNRSPLADASLRGMMGGLTLDRSRADLARKYVLTLEAIALQTRQIIEAMNQRGHRIEAIYLSGGGQARNLIYAQLIADVCGVRVQMPRHASASVVVGAAILGRLAAAVTRDRAGETRANDAVLPSQAEAEACAPLYAHTLWDLMAQTTNSGDMIFPTEDRQTLALFQAKYRIFLESIDLQRRWAKDMDHIHAN